MAAYVIGEIEVTDPAAYEDYRKQVLAVVTQYAPLIQMRKKASQGRLVLVEGA
ncbi:MAG: DUF1330 domain-containing protein [Betaproteobacteria bacterium]